MWALGARPDVSARSSRFDERRLSAWDNVFALRSVPIAFLPGASGRSSAWRPVAERLAHSAPGILVDYPGLGGAPPESAISGLSDLTREVFASLPSHRTIDVVAQSMGGVIALRAALEFPGRIRRLVLVATSGGVDIRRLGGVDWRPAWLARKTSAPTWFVDDGTDVTERLALVAPPTLLIFGDSDPISPIAIGEFLLNRLPSAQLKVVPGGTHDLIEERPDVVAEWIDAHLRL